MAPEQRSVEIVYRIPEPPLMNRLVAGTGFVPDCNTDTVPLIVAQWVYEPAKQGARVMRRLGLAA